MNNKKKYILELVFQKKALTPFSTLLIAICVALGTMAICVWQSSDQLTNEQLYQVAVIDSVTVENDEILPLVTITQDSDMVTWKDNKIMLMTINSRPERYISNETLTLPSEVWTFTDKELSAWYQKNKKGVTDWTMRLKQLIGVPPEKKYTHVTAIWVSPEDVSRPAYSPDITNPDMPRALSEDTSKEYLKWFNNNIIWSYFDSAYPWTRLGTPTIEKKTTTIMNMA